MGEPRREFNSERFGHRHCSEQYQISRSHKADHGMLAASTLIPFSAQSWRLGHLNNVPTVAMQTLLPRWVKTEKPGSSKIAPLSPQNISAPIKLQHSENG